MAHWIVYGKDAEGEPGEGKVSLVGGITDALVACFRHFGNYPRLVLRQTSDRRIRGTDGCDHLGRDMRALLHTDHFDEFPVDEEDNQAVCCLLLQRSYAGDRGTNVKWEPGDKLCRCSRCRKRIWPTTKSIGFESNGRHFVYHLDCLGVEVEM